MVDVSYGFHVSTTKIPQVFLWNLWDEPFIFKERLNGENGGTLGMVPLGIYWVYPLLKGSLGGLKS